MYLHKLKHVPCGLHFIVTSWKEDWGMTEGARVWCPECGGTEGFLHWTEERPNDEIFEHVPGSAPLVAMMP